MGLVVLVGEDQLQGVFARGEFEFGFGLALAEVDDLGIADREIVVHGRGFLVDDKVMVTGVFHFDAGRGDAHALEAKLNGHRSADGVAVLRGDDVDLRALHGRGVGGQDGGRGEQSTGGGDRGGDRDGGSRRPPPSSSSSPERRHAPRSGGGAAAAAASPSSLRRSSPVDPSKPEAKKTAEAAEGEKKGGGGILGGLFSWGDKKS